MSRVDEVISSCISRHPRETPAALAKYYEAVHQELAPLARELEADNERLRRRLEDASAAGNDFNHGVLYAAATLVRLHDQPVMAASIINEAGLGGFDCTHLDEFEKESLRKLQGEKGVRFLGL